MSLTLWVKYFQLSVKWKGEKITKVDFRGVSHYSRVLVDPGDLFYVDQRFEWPVARPVESHEVLHIQLLAYNRYFSNKVLGTYGLILHKVVQDGHLMVTDTLLDFNNRPLPAKVAFEVWYRVPDGSAGSWPEIDAYDTLDDDQQMLIDIEQNIANLERSFTQGRRGSSQSAEGVKATTASSSKRGGSLSAADKSPAPERKRSSTLKSMKSLMRLGKQRPPRDSDEEENRALLRGEGELGPKHSMGAADRVSRTSSVSSLSSDNGSQHSLSPTSADRSQQTKRLKPMASATHQSVLKAQDFQLCLTVIEARQLAGLNMDPVVCIQVGDQKKYTSVKESTNCPYYNEYFVFDYHMPPVMLFDKIITLSVLQSRNILRSNKMLGSFKLDVATVWAQPGTVKV